MPWRNAARERGVWVNVVDDAHRSAFIFPAIVDRSPLVVAGYEWQLADACLACDAIEALLPGTAWGSCRVRGSLAPGVQAALARRRNDCGSGTTSSTARSPAQLLAGDAATADEHMRDALAGARRRWTGRARCT
jgi:hypothetical protein